jgi:hypothetical protein
MENLSKPFLVPLKPLLALKIESRRSSFCSNRASAHHSTLESCEEVPDEFEAA